jgi:serine/threonine protein kinase
MTARQHQRIRDLFEAALERNPSEVGAWIESAAGDDPIVRGEVLSLLDHHSRAGEFLLQPIVERMPGLLADDDPLPLGTVVGPYTVVREIGRGGMGRVYLARDARLGRSVALKALPPSLVRDSSQRERLRREARAAAALTHPGICTVYALDEIDGALYIAAEFVDGRTLRDEIASGRRPGADDILRTARELAAALAHAHAQGVVHRDLKPENVMRTADGRLKILDFGLARYDRGVGDEIGGAGIVRAVSYATEPGTLVGTPAYMAPEQIRGQRADARADVFAFGVVMYEYACGVHPLDATPALEGPPRLATVLARCLKEIPAERYASGAEIISALDAGDTLERGAAWWRTHQAIVLALYVAAATVAWQIKEWVETSVTVSLFLALSAASTIGGVLRGHLVFTERFNRRRLPSERRRTRRATLLVDLLMGAMLLADSVLIAGRRALPAVVASSLGLGIALAALLLEPATTEAVFGEDR